MKFRCVAPLIGVGLLGLSPATISSAVQYNPKELGMDKRVPWQKSTTKPGSNPILSANPGASPTGTPALKNASSTSDASPVGATRSKSISNKLSHVPKKPISPTRSLKTFNTNGVALHYAKTGSGRPLLFIPGSVSDYRTWTKINPKFADKYECYIISRRFQYPGTYPPGGDSSVAANTNDIASFIKAKKLSPAIIIGHSFGGFVALNVAIQFPELVKCVVAEEPLFAPALARNPKNPLELLGLMFSNPKVGKSFARLGLRGMEPTFKALAKGDTLTAQKTFIDGVTDGRKTPATLDELTRRQLADNIAALVGEDPFNNSIRMADLKKIKCKTLLLTGAESPYAFQYINEQLKRAIVQSQLVTFNHAGHWIHIDQMDNYVTTVTNFLLK